MYATGYYATGYYRTGYYGRIIAPPLGFRWTYYTLILEARELLDDVGGDCPIRYSDTILVNVLNRGLQELGRIRPDAYYDLFAGNNLQVPEVTSDLALIGQTWWGNEFAPETKFYPALVYFVVGMVQAFEDEYSRGANGNPYSSRAAGSLRLFRKHVLSV